MVFSGDVEFLCHTCGPVYRLIECFIEMRVDVLNPLQVSAAEMEPERLVREFGGRIVFWGGGVRRPSLHLRLLNHSLRR